MGARKDAGLCDRCGRGIQAHFGSGGVAIGCPGGGAGQAFCQRQGCSAEVADRALGLCAKHVPGPPMRTGPKALRIANRLARGELYA